LRAVRPLRHATHVIKPAFQLASVRPAIGAGLRTATVTVVPLVVAGLLGWPPESWVSFAGFVTSLADKGGAYRTRASSTASVTIIGGLIAIVAALAGQHFSVAVPMMFVCGVTCGLARVYGDEASNIGSLVAVIFTASLATPASSLHEAMARGGHFFVGGAFATALSLFLWPIRYYKPVRRAVAECYRQLSGYFALLARLVEQHEEGAWPKLSRSEHLKIRELIESARGLLASTRRGRQGESGRGVRLLLLLEQMEKAFTLVIAIGDQLDNFGSQRAVASLRPLSSQLLLGLNRELDAIAQVIETETGAPALKLKWGPAPLTAATRALMDSPEFVHLRPQVEQLVELFERLGLALGEAIETANRLEHGGPPEQVAAASPSAKPSWKTRVLFPLRSNLNRDSIVLRHATRVGTMTAVAVCLTHWWELPMAHWVTLTVIVILQPYTGATLHKGLQRAAGTVVGGVLAAVLAAAVHDPKWILVLMFVASAVSVALLPLNYGLYSMLLTPTLVLLTELRFGNWHLASVRVTNGLLGAGLAFLGMWLLWPSPEKRRLPVELAGALDSIQRYLRAVTNVCLSPSSSARAALSESQRAAGLALINAETSFQRLLAEPVSSAELSERYMAILIHARRFASSLTALASLQRHVVPSDEPQIVAYAERLQSLLSDAARRMREDTDFFGMAEINLGLRSPQVADAVLQAQLERVTQRASDLLRLLDGHAG
jgi:uncharacterized membrane protein YccC